MMSNFIKEKDKKEKDKKQKDALQYKASVHEGLGYETKKTLIKLRQ